MTSKPKGLKYLTRFTTKLEAIDLLKVVDSNPWSTELKRRTQHYGYKYDYRERSINRESRLGPLPLFSRYLIKRMEQRRLIHNTPDQLIVNEYKPGQGISAHVDCEPCFSDEITTISLGWPYEITFTSLATGDVYNCILAVGSLLIIRDEARYEWTHQIEPRLYDGIIRRQRRVSLTFRKVILDR